MRKTAVVPAALSILLCGVLRPSHARQPNSSQPVPQAQSKFQTFGGRVVSQNAVRLVLKDYDNDVWYHIDDQQKATSFVGKNVLITGAFDGLTGTIRVQNIVEATPEQISAANTERIKQNTPPPPPPKSMPPPAVAANAPSSAPPRANPPQPVAPRVEARTPPASEARRPARVEAPINSSPPSPRPAAAAPSPSISLPEEAVSASATVAISSHRSIPMPHNFNSQRPSAKDLVVGKLVRRVSPSYPVEAKQQGIEGTVRLRAVIGADGNVQSVQPVSGPEPLVAAAVTAVREWRYGPTVLDGRRIPVQDDISLVFRLPD